MHVVNRDFPGRWTCRLLLLAATCTMLAAPTRALPSAGSPERLCDLRWLARPIEDELVMFDTFTAKPKAKKEPEGVVVAEVNGPGVLQHVMVAPGAKLWIEVDGKTVWEGTPSKDWPRVYLPPKPEERGTVPWAYPMVQTPWCLSHSVLPVPFHHHLRVRADSAKRAVWAAVRKLDQPPEHTFGDKAYLAAANAAFEALNRPKRRPFTIPDSRLEEVYVYCPPDARTSLIELDGSGEITALELDVIPAACSLLRELVIEVTPDGMKAPTVRMPLVDFLGVSQPWPHAWSPMSGDHVAGLLHPFARNRHGRQREHHLIFFKLPMPFSSGMRIELWNRSKDRPVTLYGDVQIAPLTAEQAARAGRLCGASRRLDIPRPEGEQDLFVFPRDGTLIGLSLFTTGHQTLYRGVHKWRENDRWHLIGPDGKRIAAGPGLLPFATGGNSPMWYGICWNQASVYRQGMIGAGRHFWIDPLPLTAGSRFHYTSRGENGPRRAEIGALWYAFPEAPAKAITYKAPPQPTDTEPIPPLPGTTPHGKEPGGWITEAEDWAGVGMSDRGAVEARTAGAMDALAYGGAYLAWDAEGPGATLDLLAPTPPTRYVGLWCLRVMFPAGGVFQIDLVAPDRTEPIDLWEKNDAGFRSRVLGRTESTWSVDCWAAWPWARRNMEMHRRGPPMLNPNPGGMARMRFTCVTKRSAARSYLLSLDRLGLEPAPATPTGWHECEDAPVLFCSAGSGADFMQPGRSDFHGWGGRAVTGPVAGTVKLCLFDARAGKTAEAVELRGVLEAGAWLVEVNGGEQVELKLDSGGKDGRKRGGRKKKKRGKQEPTIWRLPFPAGFERPANVTLRLRSAASNSRLLLDAWRWGTGQEGE